MPSEFSKEGTLAHAYAAKALKEAIGEDDTEGEGEEEEIKELTAYHSAEMPGHVNVYVDYVLERLHEAESVDNNARLLVEKRVSLDGGLDEYCFGTADAVIVSDWVLEVFDFKYGKGVKVAAKNNAQMRIYALGALEMMVNKGLPTPDTVRMTIVQPRIGNIATEEITLQELLCWKNIHLMPRALEAVRRYGKAYPGDWCRFCKARGECRELTSYCLGTVDEFPVPEKVTAKELAEKVLPRLAAVKTWVKDMEERALGAAMGGTPLPGWKVVEGRSLRRFTDPERVAGVLQSNGVEDIYKPQEMKSLTELEKSLGRKSFRDLLGEYVTKAPGKPTLVEESDPRPPYSAASEFASIDTDNL